MGQKKTKELTTHTHTSRKKDVHGTILCSTVTKALKRIQQKFWIWKKHFPRLHIFFPCDSSFGETTSAIYHVCIHVIYKVSLPPPCLQLVCVPTGQTLVSKPPKKTRRKSTTFDSFSRFTHRYTYFISSICLFYKLIFFSIVGFLPQRFGSLNFNNGKFENFIRGVEWWEICFFAKFAIESVPMPTH